MPDFILRYAPHMGYISPHPLFASTLGTSDCREHARFAAEQGFGGLFHPFIVSAPTDEVRRFKAALTEFGLEAGTISSLPVTEVLKPLWVSAASQDRLDLLNHVQATSRLARDLGCRVLAVLVPESSADQRTADLANVRENLKMAADLAARNDTVLGIEPIIALPNMLFQSAYDAADIIRQVNHPSVRLIFDTGHITQMDGSVIQALEDFEDIACVYQLADMPNRVEPGRGSLDFPVILSHLIKSGYSGLVELEHGWSEEGAATEAKGIALLARIEADAAKLAASL
ncbi:MAG: hypothetical protein EPO08_05300 [Rhodospirillaceae bacterium]|nr:MAG: hypothetical protein EPO08_05300 [Rhodospirillaceae bacterium]